MVTYRFISYYWCIEKRFQIKHTHSIDKKRKREGIGETSLFGVFFLTPKINTSNTLD